MIVCRWGAAVSAPGVSVGRRGHARDPKDRTYSTLVSVQRVCTCVTVVEAVHRFVEDEHGRVP